MDIDSATVDLFRAVQRAFKDSVKWPEEVVLSALYEADAETGGAGWGAFDVPPSNFKQRGMFFYAAHWLVITYNTPKGACEPSNIDSIARLNIAAQSVGDESITYRVGGIQDTEDDWLSLSNYGVQYLRMRRRAGMGARVV